MNRLYGLVAAPFEQWDLSAIVTRTGALESYAPSSILFRVFTQPRPEADLFWQNTRIYWLNATPSQI